VLVVPSKFAEAYQSTNPTATVTNVDFPVIYGSVDDVDYIVTADIATTGFPDGVYPITVSTFNDLLGYEDDTNATVTIRNGKGSISVNTLFCSGESGDFGHVDVAVFYVLPNGGYYRAGHDGPPFSYN